MDEEDPTERSKRMKKELLERIRKHEKESRESQAMNKIESPKYKRGLTLSLLAIAISIYGITVYSYKKRRILESMMSQSDTTSDEDGGLFDDKLIEEYDPELIKDEKSW